MTQPNFHIPSIFCSDNLKVLKGMDSETVDMIYLDPPFNKNKDFNQPLSQKIQVEIECFLNDFNRFNAKHKGEVCDELLKWKADYEEPCFDDTWASDTDVLNGQDWIAEIADEQKDCIVAYLHGLKALAQKKCIQKGYLSYLAFMAVRLVQMKRILKPTGSIYLHCDPTMSHHLKLLMDIVFGENQFRNEITWKRYRGKRSPAQPRKFPAVTDSILFYAKKEAVFHLPFFPLDKEYVSRTYRHDDRDGKGKYRFGGRLRNKKYYLSQSRGTPSTSLWDDIPELNGTDAEMVGYPTQKPLALLERIIEASSQKGDLVLDPFCGCATACIAAHKLKRKYVGIDISKTAYLLTVYRIYKEEFNWNKNSVLDNGKMLDQYIDVTPKFTTKTPMRTDASAIQKSKFIYIIYNRAWPGMYKVGQAIDPHKRLSSYNTGDPKKRFVIQFAQRYTNYNEVEKQTLAKFPKAKGEWISGNVKEIQKFIEEIGLVSS